MRVLAYTETRNADALASGELVSMMYADKRAVAIFINYEGKLPRFAFLDGPFRDSERPFRKTIEMAPGENIASFGKDWLFELVFNNDTFPLSGHPADDGDILEHAGKCYLKLDRPTDEPSEGGSFFDINAASFYSDLSLKKATRYTEWKLWPRPEVRTEPGATPLLHFGKRR